MQVGGIGNSELNHEKNVHHVTPGLHEHGGIDRKTGGVSASSSAFLANESKGQETAQEFSLLDMLRNALDSGKRFLGRIWGSDVNGQTGETAAAGSDAAGTTAGNTAHLAQVSSASVMVRHPQMNPNPYFTTHSDPGVIKPAFTARVRIKLRDMTGQLTKRFGDRLGGLFPGKNAFGSKKQKPQEDLRKHSRYKDGAEEIDCILTDDTYLMDSYDSRGEYSRLTTTNKRQG